MKPGSKNGGAAGAFGVLKERRRKKAGKIAQAFWMEAGEMPWDPGAGGTVNGQISGRDGGLRQSRAEVLAGCLCRGAWQVGKEEWMPV